MVINKFRCSIDYAENGTRNSSLFRITRTIRTIKAGKKNAEYYQAENKDKKTRRERGRTRLGEAMINTRSGEKKEKELKEKEKQKVKKEEKKKVKKEKKSKKEEK